MVGIPPEEARKLILRETATIAAGVVVPVAAALGGVTLRDSYAPLDNPPFDRSPLDGFAFRSADTSSASMQDPARFTIKAAVYAGDWFDGGLSSGETVSIMTGAPIPQGADCVLGKENVSFVSGPDGDYVLVSRPVARHENYVFQGEDIKKGALLFPAGTVLKSAHLGVLAGMGFDTVEIRRPLKIGLFCTGDEIIPPGSPLPLGKIYNSNETLLVARLRELGFTPETLPQMGDDAARVSRVIGERVDDFDVLITTGAVSVGDKDIFHEVFANLGVRRVFYRLSSRPGQAALCGVYRNKLLLCLSGNPFAAILSFELLVRPALAQMSGRNDIDIQYRTAFLDTPFSKKAGTRLFVRAKLTDGRVTLPGGNASGRLFSFAGCNCFVDVPADTKTLSRGDAVSVMLC
jgi:molybdopterin molybdotransferase